MTPNVLLILADQLRADHVGFGGNPTVRTPNLDALAAKSLVFDAAYVANPICMPNRCAMLTGRVPTAHGVIFNDRSLAWNSNTFVRQLAGRGYATGLIGKAHIQHGQSRDAVRPSDKANTWTDVFPSGWDSLEDYETYLDSIPDIEDFYGFGHVEFALGHGDMVQGHHYRWALERGARPEDLLTSYPNPDWPVKSRRESWWQVYQPTLPEELYSTTFVTERSIEFIRRQSADRPWFLQCSYPDPHHPFTPPGRWWDAYRPDDMQLPATFGDPLTHAPDHIRFIRRLEPRNLWTQMFGCTEAQLKDAMAAEFGMIEMMDEGIGRVLSALDESGMAEDTLILFSSDHGDMFGDHGLMLKAMLHYDGCLRVPLTVAGPGVETGRTDSLASSLDFAQTILDACETEEFDRMQGVSLTPILSDRLAEVRDHVFVEEDMPVTEGGRIPHKARTLITREGRITLYSSGEKEVYDRAADPEETNNLGKHPDHPLVASMSERLLGAMLDYSDLARLNED